MNACLVRIAATLAVVGTVAVVIALAAARHGGMLATCVL